jgi:hypothetical protein
LNRSTPGSLGFLTLIHDLLGPRAEAEG